MAEHFLFLPWYKVMISSRALIPISAHYALCRNRRVAVSSLLSCSYDPATPPSLSFSHPIVLAKFSFTLSLFCLACCPLWHLAWTGGGCCLQTYISQTCSRWQMFTFRQMHLLGLAWSSCFLSADSERFWLLFTQHSCNFHTTYKCVYTRWLCVCLLEQLQREAVHYFHLNRCHLHLHYQICSE